MTSSGDAHSGLSHSIEWPEVDGVSAGRASALGALCRIICSKKSKETITDSQLAQFYKVVYEALLEVCFRLIGNVIDKRGIYDK